MIRFEHLRVYNILDALRGMRNPVESWSKMDSEEYLSLEPTGYSAGMIVRTDVPCMYPTIRIGEKDLKLAKSLSKKGNDHAKFLRQIFVSVDVIAPMWFWKEASTYKVATVANSTSLMHRLGSRPLTENDFSMEDVVEEIRKLYIEQANELIDAWIVSGKGKPSPEWRAMQQFISSSFIYRRTWTANYQVLKTIALSERQKHKLTEWHQWIDFFNTHCPYLRELINDKD